MGEAMTSAQLIASRIIPSLGKCVWCRRCRRVAFWSELTPIGVMRCGGICPDVEQANCRCGSTLGREVRVSTTRESEAA